MKRLLITSVAALALAVAPLGVQPQANDAHHPGKTAKAKKSAGVKAKQTKKPATKPDKSSEQEVWPGARALNA